MSHSLPETRECLYETPAPQRLGKRIHQSVTNLRTHPKRRRLSAPASALELLRDVDFITDSDTSRGPSSATTDRFISNRPKLYLPLNLTPRTNRISKQLGLVDDRILNFKDDATSYVQPGEDQSTMALIRKSAASLFSHRTPSRPTSVLENLNKRRQCLMVLDSPGVPPDLDSSPITWSRHNLIALACGKNVFYQNLDTKTVSCLCSTGNPGYLGVIRWGDEKHESYMATGMSSGQLQIWDACTQDGMGTALHSWYSSSKVTGVKSFAWKHDVLAVGKEDGEVSLIDIRLPKIPTKMVGHRGRVLAVEWSADDLHLASGDSNGIVHIWDRRKTSAPLAKLRHRGSTKALAWCPWKPDLLATGSAEPEGKIRIWSTISSLSPSHEPVETLPLNTTVFSLQWSPHCKELLSTRGLSFTPGPAPSRRTVSFSGVPIRKVKTQQQLTYVPTALTNSITVHEYPSGKRLMTLPNAQGNEITQACLGPSGESIFTVCPKDETIKMWQVWSKPPPAPKKESAFDRFTIR